MNSLVSSQLRVRPKFATLALWGLATTHFPRAVNSFRRASFITMMIFRSYIFNAKEYSLRNVTLFVHMCYVCVCVCVQCCLFFSVVNPCLILCVLLWVENCIACNYLSSKIRQNKNIKKYRKKHMVNFKKNFVNFEQLWGASENFNLRSLLERR